MTAMNTQPSSNNLNLHALTPCVNLSENVYFEALDAALANNDVTNIAVTGPYGSGKSSMINSYLNARKSQTNVLNGQSIKAVSVSLAASNAGEKPSFQTIEYEILEQLFFKVKANVIPDSRISRIHEIPRWKLCLYAGGVVLTIAAVLCLYNPKFYYSWFHFPFYKESPIVLPIVSLIICAFAIGYFVYKISRIIIGATIQKISLKVAEIDLGDSKNKSVLNQHIDELIYVFHKTEWNLVIFEDLDRFNKAEIFIKLKEINQLINNSDEISKRVVFVYAVKDELFSNKLERTKFFDFIIPIIPFVDSNNADEILRQELKDYSISSKLCDILAYYVDDMRLIYNICNEYKIYRNKIFINDDDLSNDRELAILAYKNIYPDDFNKLLQRDGVLCNILHQKGKITNHLSDALNEKLKQVEDKKALKEVNVKVSKKMLRLEYIAKLEKSLPENHHFRLHNKSVFMEDLVSDDNFEQVMAGELQAWRPSYGTTDWRYSFSEIEKQVHKDSYSKRSEEIDRFATNDELNAESYSIQQEIRYIKGLSWVDIFNQYHPSLYEMLYADSKDKDEKIKKQVDLIAMLMQFGYINEHYKEYISLFHESSLQRSDRKFLLNVYRQKEMVSTYALKNPHRVLEKLDDEDFNFVAWQNNDVVKELFKSSDFLTKRDHWLDIISSGKLESIKFVGQFLSEEDDVSNIVYEICNVWPDIWICLKEQKQFNLQKILNSILLYAPLDKIPKIFSKNEEILCSNPNYFYEEQWFPRLSEIALKLQLKFTQLNNVTPNIRDFIVKNELYAINLHMLKAVIPENMLTNDFVRANYTYLKSNTKLTPIAKYIDAHIGEYVETIWRQLLSTEESEQNFRLLIDNEKLTEEQRHIIVQKCNNNIITFDELQSPELNIELLLKEGKLAPTWENVISVYNWYDCVLEDALICYLNLPLIYHQLATVKIPKTSSVLDDEQVLSFKNDLLYNAQLSNDAFKSLMHSMTIHIPWISKSLPEARILLLIKEKRILVGPKTYNFIKTNYKEAHIDYMIEYRKMLLPKLSADVLDSNDIALLSARNLKKTMATQFIKYMSAESIQESINVGILTKFSANDNRISKAQQKAILFNQSVSAVDKIMRYKENPSLLNLSDLRMFLQRLGKEYAKLLKSQAVIPYSTENETLVTLLKQAEYVSTYKIKKQGGKIHVFMHK